jgi:hypothetical protein
LTSLRTLGGQRAQQQQLPPAAMPAPCIHNMKNRFAVDISFCENN